MERVIQAKNMNHHEEAEKQALHKAKRRQKKGRPAMKMSGKGLKRFAKTKRETKH